jgi:sugar lactone lactonase YvrE
VIKPLLRLLLLTLFCSQASGQETNLYVVDVGPDRGAPWQILKYDENGQNPEVFIDEQLNRPQDIVFLEDKGIALVSNLGSNRITRHDATTGEYIDIFASGVGRPTRMEIGEDNLLYVLPWAGNSKVKRFDLDGNFVDEFTNVGVNNSIGMDWDSQGNFYVASFDGAYVRKFDPNGINQGRFVTTNLLGPTNIWFEDNGDLLVLDWTGGVIRRYSSSGAFKGNFATGLSQPEGVEFLENGHILVGNGGTSSVKQFDQNGNFVRDFVSSGLGGLATPNGLRFRTQPTYQINPGLNDAWFNPLTSGQGFLISVFPDTRMVFLAWFTFDVERPPEDVTSQLGDPGHRWLTAQGPYQGNTANLTVFVTSGGGTIKLEFVDCKNGLVSYEITSLGISSEIPIERIVQDNVALCELLGSQ